MLRLLVGDECVKKSVAMATQFLSKDGQSGYLSVLVILAKEAPTFGRRASLKKGGSMKKLQVLGPGCPRCNRLAELTEEAARSVGLDYKLEKITDIQRLAEYGIMMTPVLMVDGEVKIAGKVPSLKELTKILSQH